MAEIRTINVSDEFLRNKLNDWWKDVKGGKKTKKSDFDKIWNKLNDGVLSGTDEDFLFPILEDSEDLGTNYVKYVEDLTILFVA